MFSRRKKAICVWNDMEVSKNDMLYLIVIAEATNITDTFCPSVHWCMFSHLSLTNSLSPSLPLSFPPCTTHLLSFKFFTLHLRLVGVCNKGCSRGMPAFQPLMRELESGFIRVRCHASARSPPTLSACAACPRLHNQPLPVYASLGSSTQMRTLYVNVYMLRLGRLRGYDL